MQAACKMGGSFCSHGEASGQPRHRQRRKERERGKERERESEREKERESVCVCVCVWGARKGDLESSRDKMRDERE